MGRATLIVLLTLLVAFTVRDSGVDAQTSTSMYGSGWNLVAGPDGARLTGAAGSLYTLQPGDTEYESFPADSALHGGWGYWAYFPTGGSLQLPANGAQPASAEPDIRVSLSAGEYAMLGNSTVQSTVTVINARQVLTYSAANGYQPALILRPGEGAFVTAPGTVVIGSEPLVEAPGDSACPASTPADSPIVVQSGKPFVLALASNRTTGYQWFLVGALDPAALEFVGNAYVAPAPTSGGPPIVGQGGKECWTFRAIASTGTATIQFALRRPFEPPSTPPAQNLSFTIVPGPP